MDDDQQDLARTLGVSIRTARRAAGMTLTELAKASQLSQPFLSQAENGNVMPSVINLHRVAQALGTTAHELLEQGTRQPARVVRANRSRSYPLGPAAVLRFCVEGARQMDCNEVTADAHSSAESATSHPGEEFVYMISGRIRFEVDGDAHDLGAGDTVYYAATSPHRWFNDSDEQATFLFIGTPPGF